uniref:Uncharacterized protein n=1 Tax=Oryza glumipatula TaxID=40148 RepID=A0A0D9Y953_9ORYZ
MTVRATRQPPLAPTHASHPPCMQTDSSSSPLPLPKPAATELVSSSADADERADSAKRRATSTGAPRRRP